MALDPTRESAGRRDGHVVEQLSAYLDGELGAAARGGIEAHTKGCAECARELATLRATRQLLRELAPIPAPRSFILSPQMVAPQVTERVSPILAWLPRLRLATAALAVLLVLVLSADAINSAGLRSAARSTGISQALVPAATGTTRSLVAAETGSNSPVAATGGSDAAADSAGLLSSTPQAASAPAAEATSTTAAAAPTDAAMLAANSAAAAPTDTPNIAATARNAGVQANTTSAALTFAAQGTAVPAMKQPAAAAAAAPDALDQTAVAAAPLNWLWLEVPLGVIIFALTALLLIFSRRGSMG